MCWWPDGFDCTAGGGLHSMNSLAASPGIAFTFAWRLAQIKDTRALIQRNMQRRK